MIVPPDAWAGSVQDRTDPALEALAASVKPRPRQPPPPPEEPPALQFPDSPTWVQDWLAPFYRRAFGQNRVWCQTWWEHPEAVLTLDALWRAWEHLGLDGATGMSVWLRDHYRPHMDALTDPDGPMRSCTPERHQDRPEPLPVGKPPDGLFS